VVALGQPRPEPFGRQRDRIRAGNADNIEPERTGPVDEGTLEGLSL
jgi:hypothetical protein